MDLQIRELTFDEVLGLNLPYVDHAVIDWWRAKIEQDPVSPYAVAAFDGEDAIGIVLGFYCDETVECMRLSLEDADWQEIVAYMLLRKLVERALTYAHGYCCLNMNGVPLRVLRSLQALGVWKGERGYACFNDRGLAHMAKAFGVAGID